MKRYRISHLPSGGRHVFSGLVAGNSIATGALRFRPAGFVAHPDEPVHAHDFPEAFVILQGEAILRLEEQVEALRPGDVIIAEPGENHHLEVGGGGPAVYVFLQFGEEPTG